MNSTFLFKGCHFASTMAILQSSRQLLHVTSILKRCTLSCKKLGTIQNIEILQKSSFLSNLGSSGSGLSNLQRPVTKSAPLSKTACLVKTIARRSLCIVMPTRLSSVSAIVSKGLPEVKSRSVGLPKGISKDSSPLTTKKIVRRKRFKDAKAKDTEIYQAVATSTAEEYQLSYLETDLLEQGLYKLLPVPEDVDDTLHLEAIYRVGDEPREIFIFQNGSLVFWNMPEEEQRSVLKFIKRHEIGSYDSILVDEATDSVEYSYTDQGTQLYGDEVQFGKTVVAEPLDRSRLQLEKYTYSDILSQSVKLSIWEASLELYVDSIEHARMALKSGNKIRLTEAEILQRAGELLHYRHQINLNLELLDTPDFYWDRPEFEALYRDARNHFNIARRTRVMNDKVTACLELIELLRDCFKEKVHTRLEWLIIVLIFIEVLFGLREIIHETKQKKRAENE